MNLSLVGEGSSFVPRSIIIKRLEKYMPKREVKTFRYVLCISIYFAYLCPSLNALRPSSNLFRVILEHNHKVSYIDCQTTFKAY